MEHSSIDLTQDGPTVDINISVVSEGPQRNVDKLDEDYDLWPVRNVTLDAHNKWSIRIGRGSNSDLRLSPHENNTWFYSRVMSRNHALLKADPVMRRITIEDVGSMHGTYLNGERLCSRTEEVVVQGDVVVFGTEIVRGAERYAPLRMRVEYVWSDKDDHLTAMTPSPGRSNRNTFSADYSDDELEILSPAPGPYRLATNARPSWVHEHSEATAPGSTSEQTDSRQGSSPSDPTEISDDEVEEFNVLKISERCVKDVRPTDETDVQILDSVPDNREESPDGESEDGARGDLAANGRLDGIAPGLTLLEEPQRPPVIQAPLSLQAREPSPSDAAMAKPHASPSSTSQIHPNQDSSQFTHADWYKYSQPALLGSLSRFDPHLRATDDTKETFQSSWFAPAHLHSPPSVPALLANTHPALPTVDDILPVVVHDSNVDYPGLGLPPSSEARKRKAEFISGSAYLEKLTMSDPNATLESSAGQATSNVQTLEPRTRGGSSAPNERDDRAIHFVAEVDDKEVGRQRKRTKRGSAHGQGRGSQVSSIMRYTGAVLAGAVVGAAGTIFGLAALPQDYFN